MKKQYVLLSLLLFAISFVGNVNANNISNNFHIVLEEDQNQLEKLRKNKKDLEQRIVQTTDAAQKAILQKELDEITEKIVFLTQEAPSSVQITPVTLATPPNKSAKAPQNQAPQLAVEEEVGQAEKAIANESKSVKIAPVVVVMPPNKSAKAPQNQAPQLVVEEEVGQAEKAMTNKSQSVKITPVIVATPENKSISNNSQNQAPKLTLEEKIDQAKKVMTDANANAEEKAKAQKLLDTLKAKSQQRLDSPDISQESKLKAQKLLDYLSK